MDSERLSENHWGNIPHTELPLFATDEKTESEIRYLKTFLASNDVILDLGCGWGRIALALTNCGYNVTGVDLSANLIDYARESASRQNLLIKFDVGSVLQVPYDNNAFDKILCLWGVFSHLLTLDEQIKALNEMHRLLRSGGVALIEVSNGESKKYQDLMATQGYGFENRVCKFVFKSLPNILYIHTRTSLTAVAKESAFDNVSAKFQNINGKRRLTLWLWK